MDNIPEVNAANFETEVLKSDKPVLVEFFATWCGHCKLLAPTLDKIAAEKTDTVKTVQVDVDASPELAEQYFIELKPTLLIIRDGKIIGRKIGNATKADLTKWIDRSLTLPRGAQINPEWKDVSLSGHDKKRLREAFESAANALPEADRLKVKRGLDSGNTFRLIEAVLSSGSKETVDDIIRNVAKNGLGIPKSPKP